MQHERTHLRQVILSDGDIGFFHGWSDHLEYWDGKQYPSAIVERMDGTIKFVAGPGLIFDPRSLEERKMGRGETEFELRAMEQKEACERKYDSLVKPLAIQ